MTCRFCETALPEPSGKGRPRVICDSLDCHRENRRFIRGRGENYLDTCLWCRLPLPTQVTGTPRKYCEGDACKDAHLASRWADYRGRLKTKDLLANLDEEMFGGCTITEGRDHPLSRSWVAVRTTLGWRLDGTCDFNPKTYTAEDGSQPEWLVVFLSEFGSAGPEVGVSRGQGQDYVIDMGDDYTMWWTKGETGL